MIEIKECLEGLLKSRVENSDWSDSVSVEEEDVQKLGILKIAEALECFFSIAPDIECFDKKFRSEVPVLKKEILLNDLKKITDIIDNYGYIPSPYLDKNFDEEGISLETGKIDFTDTVSFVVTTLLDAMEYYKVFYEQDLPNVREYLEYIKNGINWLIDNAIPGEGPFAYWSWGKKSSKSKPGLYFTWTACVALSTALESKFSPLSNQTKEKLKEILKGCYNWVQSIVEKDSEYPKDEKRVWVSFPGYADSEKCDQRGMLIYVLSLLEAISPYIDQKVNPQLLDKIIHTILKIFSDEDWRISEGGDHIVLYEHEGRIIKIEYIDKIYRYVLLAGLSWAFSWARENKDMAFEEWIDNLREVACKLKNEVLSKRDKEKKTWEERSFQIYANQRAIESLIFFNKYVDPYLEKKMDKKAILSLAVEDAFKEVKSTLVDEIFKKMESLEKRQEK